MVPLKLKLRRSENASVMAKASFMVTEVDNWKLQDKFGSALEPVTEHNLKNKKLTILNWSKPPEQNNLKCLTYVLKTLLMN